MAENEENEISEELEKVEESRGTIKNPYAILDAFVDKYVEFTQTRRDQWISKVEDMGFDNPKPNYSETIFPVPHQCNSFETFKKGLKKDLKILLAVSVEDFFLKLPRLLERQLWILCIILLTNWEITKKSLRKN